jgi:hypothetical protein
MRWPLLSSSIVSFETCEEGRLLLFLVACQQVEDQAADAAGCRPDGGPFFPSCFSI